jgi:hypothetical protein
MLVSVTRASTTAFAAALGLAACLALAAPAPAHATAFIEQPSSAATMSATSFPGVTQVASDTAAAVPRRAIADHLGGQPIWRLQPAGKRKVVRPPTPVASAKQFSRAVAWAKQRRGTVSFVVIDEKGRLRGYQMNRQYVSASVVKAMLLVAYLRQDPTPGPGMRATLRSMIQYSDNNAAAAVYRMVGDAGLNRVARSAGMTNYQPNGWWSLSQITAADQARFFYTMDRQIPARSRTFARELLSHIITQQSWGVPRVARPLGWQVYFKGGWRGTDRGQLVHQASRLERGKRRVAIVVLTDGNPSETYGIETVRGMAERLMR